MPRDRFPQTTLVEFVVHATHPEDEDAVLAAGRLDALLRSATPSELMRLEADYRSCRRTLASSTLLEADRPDRARLAVAALMTFDRDGAGGRGRFATVGGRPSR